MRPGNLFLRVSRICNSARIVIFDIAFLWVMGACCHAGEGTNKLQFNRDVLPILGDHCYACHGPDEQSREFGLRLDQRTGALGTNGEEAVIVPGQPELSEFVRRIESDDPDEIMPPSSHNKPLTVSEKQILQRWISEGAEYQKHWSFVPPARAALPVVASGDWSENPIDAFVYARMNQAGFSPAIQADRNTLIRRVTLDLTGLPPTADEVAAFENDAGEDAYCRVVDRLMETTAYAERRTQDWLDLARYADTRGFADDQMRAVWPWRDWVIRAINQNMPFDQFSIEQLAGDMLPNATDEQRLATGFLRNAPQAKGMTYPVEEYRIKGVIDRVNTIGRVWLGLTLDCAECHDHKFDPISQRDYYSLLAMFNNVAHSGEGFQQGGPTMEYRLPHSEHISRVTEQRQRLLVQIENAKQKLRPPKSLQASQVLGTWDRPTTYDDPALFSLQKNLTIVAKIRTDAAVADIVSKYDWRAQQRGYVFGIGGEGDSNSLPGHLFFWVSSRPDVFLGATVYSSFPVNDGNEHHVAVEFVAGKSVRLWIDGVEDLAAKVTGAIPEAISVSDRNLAIGHGYSGDPTQPAYQFKGTLSEVQLSDQVLGDQISIGSAGKELAALRQALTKQHSSAIESQFVVKAVPVMQELSEPRKTFVHIRGNFLDHGDQVGPAVPSAFDVAGSFQPKNRFEFARWLVSRQNPIVARVVVNRFWQAYFGHGLVRSPDDFGVQGTQPTHPLLLDWLATEFVSSGWDMKHLNRLIVTSKTYRQSARVPVKSIKEDPDNLLLTYMPRVRLPAEQIRDQALAVSGLLTTSVGGPPVFPSQPAGYWNERVLPGKWVNSIGLDRHRKSIYSYWRRMALHPTLELLDAPARVNCVVKRELSNIPTQALVLLNDPIFVEAARGFARRLMEQVDGDDEQRITMAYRWLLSRSPDQHELQRFSHYVSSQRDAFATDLPAARAITTGDANGSPAQLAVWTLVCGALLNCDEALTRP